MIKKSDTCLYCGEEMESQTAKKKFCSTKCRVYYNRELKTLKISEGIKEDEKVADKVIKKETLQTPINLSYLKKRQEKKLK